jgi:hypothetical protein
MLGTSEGVILMAEEVDDFVAPLLFLLTIPIWLTIASCGRW